MIRRSGQPSLWAPRWARRLGTVSAMVTILAGVPGAVATIAYFTNSYWPDPPKALPSPTSRSIPLRPGPGPGRCPQYHFYKDGRCQDARLRHHGSTGPRS